MKKVLPMMIFLASLFPLTQAEAAIPLRIHEIYNCEGLYSEQPDLSPDTTKTEFMNNYGNDWSKWCMSKNTFFRVTLASGNQIAARYSLTYPTFKITKYKWSIDSNGENSLFVNLQASRIDTIPLVASKSYTIGFSSIYASDLLEKTFSQQELIKAKWSLGFTLHVADDPMNVNPEDAIWVLGGK